MSDFICRRLRVPRAEAERLRGRWWHEHGATLLGAAVELGVAPEEFLGAVHSVPLAGLAPDPGLARALAALPGRRWVHTNACARHAERVLARLGVLDLFDGVFDVGDAGWTPKPSVANHRAFLARFEVDPVRAVLFEDSGANLETAAGLGMATVLVRPDAPGEAPPGAAAPAGGLPSRGRGRFDHETADLAACLRALAAAAGGASPSVAS